MAAEISTELRKYRSLTIALIAGITVSVVMFVAFLSVDLDQSRREIGMQSRLTSQYAQNRLRSILTGIASATNPRRIEGNSTQQDRAVALERSLKGLGLADASWAYCVWSGDKSRPLLSSGGGCLDVSSGDSLAAVPLDLPGNARGNLAVIRHGPYDSMFDVRLTMSAGLNASLRIPVQSLLAVPAELSQEALRERIETCLYIMLESGPISAGCNMPPAIPSVATDPAQFAASSPISYDAGFRAADLDWRIVSVLKPSAMVSAISMTPITILLFFLVATGFVCWYVYSSTGTNLQLRRQQAQINAGLQELNKRNEDLEQFAYMASHDLQTPVRHIMSRATMLRDDLDDEAYVDAAHNTRVIIDASKRMQSFILDLLAFCRAGEDHMEKVQVDVKQLVEHQLSMIRDAEAPPDMSVNVGALPTVHTDRVKLSQVFQNLLTNAVRFRRTDKPLTVDIEAEWDEQHHEWRFEVRDNGIGIAEEHYERIFLPFKQLDAKHNTAGTGIGLSIAKKVIERLGGRIWVESGEGGGSSFYFTLSGVYTGPRTVGTPAIGRAAMGSEE